jgi:hypothetical protein
LTLVDDDEDDVGFAPHESCESSHGACHSRLDRGAVLGESTSQARQNTSDRDSVRSGPAALCQVLFILALPCGVCMAPN